MVVLVVVGAVVVDAVVVVVVAIVVVGGVVIGVLVELAHNVVSACGRYESFLCQPLTSMAGCLENLNTDPRFLCDTLCSHDG